MQDKPDIQSMFNRISPRYNLLNRLLSGGQDMRWRRKAVELLGDLRGKMVLDLCCGTGDFIKIFNEKYKTDIDILGIDFARSMLAQAQARFSENGFELLLCQADGLALPCRDSSIDAVTIGFGIRNISDRLSALKEIKRVLTPGGRLVIIEPTIPDNFLIGWPFSIYFKYIMPFIGGIISGDWAAYKYLDASVSEFPSPDKFVALMRTAGFTSAKAVPQLLGMAMIYYGEKLISND